jgi:hypothetical protein
MLRRNRSCRQGHLGAAALLIIAILFVQLGASVHVRSAAKTPAVCPVSVASKRQHASNRRSIKDWPCAAGKSVARDRRLNPIWLASSDLMSRATNTTALSAPMLGSGHLAGKVTLEILIDADGKVECARAIEGHPIAVSSALDAVPKWTFKPYLLRGRRKAVLGVLVVPYDFQR